MVSASIRAVVSASVIEDVHERQHVRFPSVLDEDRHQLSLSDTVCRTDLLWQTGFVLPSSNRVIARRTQPAVTAGPSLPTTISAIAASANAIAGRSSGAKPSVGRISPIGLLSKSSTSGRLKYEQPLPCPAQRTGGEPGRVYVGSGARLAVSM